MSELNVPLPEDKRLRPVKVIVYLGLGLDTVNMVVRIQQSKLNEIKEKNLHFFQNQKRVAFQNHIIIFVLKKQLV
jgi:hypothetical protein